MDNFHILGYPVIGYKENKDDDDDNKIEGTHLELYAVSYL